MGPSLLVERSNVYIDPSFMTYGPNFIMASTYSPLINIEKISFQYLLKANMDPSLLVLEAYKPLFTTVLKAYTCIPALRPLTPFLRHMGIMY